MDDVLIETRKELSSLNASYQFLATENYDIRLQVENLVAEKENLIQNNQYKVIIYILRIYNIDIIYVIKDKMIEDLQNELAEAKGTMQKLSDVQNVLNRILGSQELLNKFDIMN